MSLFKKAIRPVVKQTKEVIAEELTASTSKTPEKVETEVVKEDSSVTIKVDTDILKVVCVGLGLIALMMLRRKPDVKVYVIK